MKKVVIMGAGPAGLAAGYELQKKGIDVDLFEAAPQVGGISKTVCHHGYYFDLGGHRFFTKFPEVNKLWQEVLGESFRDTPRLSRIYYRNKFFDYPLTPLNALFGVGVINTFVIIASFLKAKIFPCPKEDTFEEWVSNRFGKKLYGIFFKTYTEKVWGIPCSSIQAEWAAQRIKGLSLGRAIWNAFFKSKKNKITTLIDEFKYPIHGPGMMYDAMAEKIKVLGGSAKTKARVIRVNHRDFHIESIDYEDENGRHTAAADKFVSSIPITELVTILNPAPPDEIRAAAGGLRYRSLVTVDVVINRKNVFPDNWIYIHSPEVKLGRIQNFKNWSPDMAPDENKTSLGLEYFCDEGDEFWKMSDEEIFQFAAQEVEKIKICRASEIEDHIVVRVPKAYPVYMLGYREHLDKLADYLKKFRNLQLIGRYGLFKYNNMDHSILTGLYAAKNIEEGKIVDDTWSVNVDDEYQEEKSS